MSGDIMVISCVEELMMICLVVSNTDDVPIEHLATWDGFFRQRVAKNGRNLGLFWILSGGSVSHSHSNSSAGYSPISLLLAGPKKIEP